MDTKDEIRRMMRERRRALTSAERTASSETVCEKLAARNIHAPVAVYLASSQEIDLTPFIQRMLARSVRIVAPRWNGESYELAVLKGLDWYDRLLAEAARDALKFGIAHAFQVVDDLLIGMDPSRAARRS